MKNLFKYAKRELSQDAFLRWVIENYNCEEENVRHVARGIILDFLKEGRCCKDYIEDDIEKLWTKSQDHYCDISIWVKMKSGERYGILIEDKVFSFIHNSQLTKYKNIFENDNWWKENTNQKIYIFYKPDIINDTKEEDEINNNGWIKYDIQKIYELFKKLAPTKTNNMILDFYIEHINNKYKAYVESKWYEPGDWDLRAYQLFIKNELKVMFDCENEKIWDYADGDLYSGRGSYDWFCAHRKIINDNHIELDMQFRINEQKIICAIQYYIDAPKDSKRKKLIPKDGTVSLVKDIISKDFKDYFEIKENKGKVTIASLKSSIDLYTLNPKEELKEIIKKIKDLMESKFDSLSVNDNV